MGSEIKKRREKGSPGGLLGGTLGGTAINLEPKAAFPALWEAKGAKREPKGDQNGSQK